MIELPVNAHRISYDQLSSIWIVLDVQYPCTASLGWLTHAISPDYNIPDGDATKLPLARRLASLRGAEARLLNGFSAALRPQQQQQQQVTSIIYLPIRYTASALRPTQCCHINKLTGLETRPQLMNRLFRRMLLPEMCKRKQYPVILCVTFPV